MFGVKNQDRLPISNNIPIIPAGSAGGYFQTGKFVDYRNQNIDYGNTSTTQTDHPGLIYNRWMGTILQSMGLSPADYEMGIDIDTGSPVEGYRMYKIDPDKVADYTEAELLWVKSSGDYLEEKNVYLVSVLHFVFLQK